MEDFSLHKALSSSSPLSVEDEEEVCGVGDGHHRSSTIDSIPSLSESLEVCDLYSDIVVPQDATNKDDAADSVLAWGCLAALLGSPAPTSVLLAEKKQKKRRPGNLWQDDEAMDEDLDGILSSLPQDDEDSCSLPSLSSEAELEDLVPVMDDSIDLAFCTTPTAENSTKDVADSTLAWSVLTAILGSPAPSSVVKRNASKKRVNLWEDDEESGLLPEIYEQDDDDDESDVLSLPSIDMNELETAEDWVEIEQAGSKEESADSVLIWSALGMFLGSPAPKLLAKKSRKMSVDAARRLWDDGESDAIPSIFPEDNEIACILSPASTAQKWFVKRDASDYDNDNHSMPSLSRMTFLSETTDDEDEYPSSPLNQSMMSFDDLINSPKWESSSKSIADSVLAWSALAAFMGSPAPKALSPKRKKEAKFLWGEECDVLPADLNLPF